MFDADALTDFLSSSFDKKLREYKIYILRVDLEYLTLEQSFYDFIEKMERKHFILFKMLQVDRHWNEEATHQDKIPGMITVKQLEVEEWDLMYPYLGYI